MLLSDLCKFKPNKTFYTSAGKNVSGVQVYSYAGVSDSNELKRIKTQFNIHSDDAKFIKETVESRSLSFQPDLIISPTSSSPMLNFFVKTLGDYYNVNVITDAFVKSLPSDVSFNPAGISLDDKTIKAMEKILSKAVDTGKFEIKKFPPKYRSMLENLMVSNMAMELVEGKSIMLVDDILTTGSTMNSIFKTVQSSGCKRLCGATFLKF